jgi:hypothetical protein
VALILYREKAKAAKKDMIIARDTEETDRTMLLIRYGIVLDIPWPRPNKARLICSRVGTKISFGGTAKMSLSVLKAASTIQKIGKKKIKATNQRIK